jgi:hypothetical protein
MESRGGVLRGDAASTAGQNEAFIPGRGHRFGLPFGCQQHSLSSKKELGGRRSSARNGRTPEATHLQTVPPV